MFVLVEYCRYGNLLMYVINARGRFINQIDSAGNLLISSNQQQDTILNVASENYITIYTIIDNRYAIIASLKKNLSDS